MNAVVLSPADLQRLADQVRSDLATATQQEQALAALLAPAHAARIRYEEVRDQMTQLHAAAADRVQMFSSLLQLLQSLAEAQPTQAAPAPA